MLHQFHSLNLHTPTRTKCSLHCIHIEGNRETLFGPLSYISQEDNKFFLSTSFQINYFSSQCKLGAPASCVLSSSCIRDTSNFSLFSRRHFVHSHRTVKSSIHLYPSASLSSRCLLLLHFVYSSWRNNLLIALHLTQSLSLTPC